MAYKQKLSSIIDELDKFVPDNHKHKIIEARALNAISASINVLELIRTSFTEQEYEDLTKKLLLAMKSGEPKKFTNKIRMLGEDDAD